MIFRLNYFLESIQFDDMPENLTTESNFANDLIQIARSYLKRLQQRYRDNEMQAAVRNWRERMEPLLAMEEEREPFNIRRTIKRIDECLVDRQVKHCTIIYGPLMTMSQTI